MDSVGIAVTGFSGVAFNIQNNVGFVLGAGCVLQRDDELRRIEVDAELMRTSGAADAQVAHEGFFTDYGFFAGDLIPLFAFLLDGGCDTLPNDAAEADASFPAHLAPLPFKI